MRRTLVVELGLRDEVLRAYAVFTGVTGDLLGSPWNLELDADLRKSPQAALAALVVWAWPDTGSGTAF